VVLDKFLNSLKKAPSGRLFFSQILGAAALLLMLASWLNPNHYAPWVVFENEASAFAGVLIAAVALVVRGRKFALSPAYAGWFFFTLLVVLAQYGLGLISWQFMGLGVLYLATLCLSVSVGYSLLQSVETNAAQFENTVLALLLLGIVGSAGVVLGQWLYVENYYPLLMAEHGDLRPFGNLGQPNNQGTLLITGILCVELLLRKKAINHVVAGLGMVVLIPAIAATGSRTVILSAVVAVLYLFVVARTRAWCFTLAWLLTLLVCFFVMPKLGVGNGVDVARVGGTLTDSPRLHIYQQLVWAIADRPWTGYGWMQTAYAQSQAAAQVYGGVEADYAHNVVLDLWVWFGIPLGTLLMLLLGYAAASNWRRSSARGRAAYVLLVPFGVHSLLEFPFAYAFFLLPAGMLLGYLGGQADTKPASKLALLRFGWKAVALWLALLTALSAAVFTDYIGMAEDFRVLRFENKKIGKVPEGFVQSSPLILTDLGFMMEVLRYTPRAGESSEKFEKIRHYVLHNHYPGAHVKLISLQIQDRRFDEAAEEIHRYKNLYGDAIAKWGVSTLSAAYCQDAKTRKENERVCSVLLGKTVPGSDLNGQGESSGKAESLSF
jgi:hypothetical protein